MTWVNTRGLDAETVANFAIELQTIRNLWESYFEFIEFVLDEAQKFQDIYSDLESWEDFEPNGEIVDYMTAIEEFCDQIKARRAGM